MTKRALILSCAACLAAGYLVACVPGFDPVNPFVPARPDRPVARLLAKLAKVGLWVMVFADPPQASKRPAMSRYYGEGDAVCHAEGW